VIFFGIVLLGLVGFCIYRNFYSAKHADGYEEKEADNEQVSNKLDAAKSPGKEGTKGPELASMPPK
jgi:hypothetical protein